VRTACSLVKPARLSAGVPQACFGQYLARWIAECGAAAVRLVVGAASEFREFEAGFWLMLNISGAIIRHPAAADAVGVLSRRCCMHRAGLVALNLPLIFGCTLQMSGSRIALPLTKLTAGSCWTRCKAHASSLGYAARMSTGMASFCCSNAYDAPGPGPATDSQIYM